MTRSSPWPKLLPPLGIVLAVALLAAAGSVWWSGGGTITVSDGGLGELIAVTQAARTEANAAVSRGSRVVRRRRGQPRRHRALAQRRRGQRGRQR